MGCPFYLDAKGTKRSRLRILKSLQPCGWRFSMVLLLSGTIKIANNRYEKRCFASRLSLRIHRPRNNREAVTLKFPSKEEWILRVVQNSGWVLLIDPFFILERLCHPIPAMSLRGACRRGVSSVDTGWLLGNGRGWDTAWGDTSIFLSANYLVTVFE